MGVWSVVGGLVGTALALGFAGHARKHWAVRVLSGVAFVLLLVVLLIAGLIGGKDSAASLAWSPLLVSFAVVAMGNGLVWLVAGVRHLLVSRSAIEKTDVSIEKT